MWHLRLYLLLAGAGICEGQICFSATLIVACSVCPREGKTLLHTHSYVVTLSHICTLQAASFGEMTQLEDHKRDKICLDGVL